MNPLLAPAHAGPALPLVPVAPAHLAAALAALPAAQRRWAESLAFTAQPGTWCGLPGPDGALAAVLAGVPDAFELHALAPLPLTLPPGTYRLQDGHASFASELAVLGWALGGYQFTRYRAARRAPAALVCPDGVAMDRAQALADASFRVRDLVNTPAEDLGPGELEAAVRALGETHGAAVRSVVGGALLEHNFPAIHAVGRASHRAPRLIELYWGDPAHPRLAVIGKGVCFDTGGLDLKPSDGMRWMKKDMGGAAHAIALADLVMRLALPVRLQLLIPAVENAVGPEAYRPGEVIRTRAGLSVEIDNTDAEGRVILCDALTLATESAPALVIDFATLTGAARVALGPELPALFANRDELAQEFAAHGRAVHDPVWPMPLWQPYRSMLDSHVADLANSSPSRMAGAVTAALYLQRFVPDTVPWCHLDTYSWNDAERPGRPRGGEAQGLRAALALIEARFR